MLTGNIYPSLHLFTHYHGIVDICSNITRLRKICLT